MEKFPPVKRWGGGAKRLTTGASELFTEPVHVSSRSSSSHRLRKDPGGSKDLLPRSHRGRVLKITEDVGGRRNTIILPPEAFGDFVAALERLVEFEGKL